MNVNITARHCSISETIRKRASERMQRLTKYEPRLASADVIFDTDRDMKLVEARVFLTGGPTTLAHGSAETFQMALDRATDRLRRQLKRRRERDRQHQSVKMSETTAPIQDESLGGEDTHG